MPSSSTPHADPIIDEVALVDALRTGQLAAAGLDVFAVEPIPADNPLLGLDNVVLTPHVTWYTADTMRRYLAEAVDNCRRIRAGEDLSNTSSIRPGRLVPNRPVIREAQRRTPAMPIAISPEHNDLADSVRSLVARVAPSDVLHEALETPISNPPPYWKAAAEQGLQGVHLAEVRWRTRLRHPRTRDRARRVRLRRGAGAVRPFGDRQRADLRPRPRRQAAQRPGVRRR